MIASLTGRVASIRGDSAVIVAGGVGYRVHAGPGLLGTLVAGEEATVHTYHLVREDQQALYGFRTEEEDRKSTRLNSSH